MASETLPQLTNSEVRTEGRVVHHSDFVIQCQSGSDHWSFVIGFMILSPDKKIAGVLAPLFGLRSENDLGTGDVVHWLRLEGMVRELYDVAALPGVRRPMALGLKTDEIRRTIAIGDEESLS